MPRVVAVMLVVASVLAVQVAAQDAGTGLVRPLRAAEREELAALIEVVDTAARDGTVQADPAAWQVHYLQTSDGLGYIPFTLEIDPQRFSSSSFRVYVRVASRAAAGAPPEHSTLRQWLKRPAGQFIPPVKGSSAFSGVMRGEMPVGGPSLSMARSDPASVEATAQLRILDKEKAEAEQAKGSAADIEARSAAEQRAAGEFVFPFEDFDFSPAPVGQPGASLLLQRALAVPPGEYDVYVALGERARSRKDIGKVATAVFKHTVVVPPRISDAPDLSSIILAERVLSLDKPYTPDLQSSHPYALGWAEIIPARDQEFDLETPLATVFQVKNPYPTAARKPDLVASYRVFRVGPDAERLVRTLETQRYNSSTLAPEFDLAKGHMVVAMQALPVRGLGAGDFRLEVSVTDRVADKTTVKSVAFSIVAPPDVLLRNAPPLVPALTRRDVLQGGAVGAVLEALANATPSGVTAQALDHARRGDFASLIGLEATSADDRAIAPLLRGIALLALEDTPAAAVVQFEQAQKDPRTRTAADVLLGACFAIQGRDTDAVARWEAVRTGGLSAPWLATLLAPAHIRAKAPARALSVIEDIPEDTASVGEFVRLKASTLVALEREADAVAALDQHLAGHPDDLDARFLALRAVFGAFVGGRPPGTTPEGQARFVQDVRAYTERGGPRVILVQEWEKALRRAARPDQDSR